MVNWTHAVHADPFQRFTWGEPPPKQGDYAYLLHIIRSMKGAGKAACILPHGVLFRGNAEATIRERLVRSGYLKGVIGLPPNLFYGTGIPACIVVLDKENAAGRRGVFMIDASRGFRKDGPKNRLREQDIHRIVDTFTRQVNVPRYARMVPIDEIAKPKNDFNLNLPRYIDSTEARGPDKTLTVTWAAASRNSSLDALEAYWQVFPSVRNVTVRNRRSPRLRATEAAVSTEMKGAILEHPEFSAFQQEGPRRSLLVGSSATTPCLIRLRQGWSPEGADRDHRGGSAGGIPPGCRCSMPTTSTST